MQKVQEKYGQAPRAKNGKTKIKPEMGRQYRKRRSFIQQMLQRHP